MKKEYMKPSMEAIEIKMGQQLLAGSVKSIGGGSGTGLDIGGGGDGTSTGGGAGRAPGLFDDPAWDALLGE